MKTITIYHLPIGLIRKFFDSMKLAILLCILTPAMLRAQDTQLNNEEPIDVFLVIGSSNAAGRAPFENADLAQNSNVYLLNSNLQFEQAGIEEIDYLDNGQTVKKYQGYNRYSNISTSFGMADCADGYNMAQAFGNALNGLTGEKVGLIVNARANTSLEDWLENSAALFDDIENSSVNLFDNTMNRIIALNAAYPNARLKGVIWMQGEVEQEYYRMTQDDQRMQLPGELWPQNMPLSSPEFNQAQDQAIDALFDNYKSDFINELVEPMRLVLASQMPDKGYGDLPFFIMELGPWDKSINHNDWQGADKSMFEADEGTYTDLNRSFTRINQTLGTIPDRENENYIYLVESDGLEDNDWCAGSGDFCPGDPYSCYPAPDGIHYNRASLELLGIRAAERFEEAANGFLDMSSQVAHYPMNMFVHSYYKEHQFRINNSRGKWKTNGDEFLELRHWDVSGNHLHGAYYGVNKSVGTEKYIQSTPPFFPMYTRNKVTIQAQNKDGTAIMKNGATIEKFGNYDLDNNLTQGWINYGSHDDDAIQAVKKPAVSKTWMAIPTKVLGNDADVNDGFAVSFWLEIKPTDGVERTILSTRYFRVYKHGDLINVRWKSADEGGAVEMQGFDLKDIWSRPDDGSTPKKDMYFFTVTNDAGKIRLYAKNFRDLSKPEFGNVHDRNVLEVEPVEAPIDFKVSVDHAYLSDSPAETDQSRIMSEKFKGRIWNVRFFNKTLDKSEARRLFKLDMSSISYAVNLDNQFHYDPLNHVKTNKQAYYAKGSDHQGERFFGMYNEIEGYTVSFWVDIQEEYDTRDQSLPFLKGDIGDSFYRVTDGTNVLAGIERRNDAIGINRYYVDDKGDFFPWYQWYYEPATFNKEWGKGKYHVVMSYYPNMVRLYMYHPDKDQFVRRLNYTGAQDLSRATTWEVNPNIEKFSVYNWTLDSLEVNALHYFDKQDFMDTEKDSYNYNQVTKKDQKYLPSFALIGDFGCAGGGCNQQGAEETCPVPVNDPDGNYSRAADPEAVSNMVKGWKPDFIVSVGGTNYGEMSDGFNCPLTYEENVGQFYSEYISPYTGEEHKNNRNYSPMGNRFFSSIGQEDYKGNQAEGLDEYLSFFNSCDVDPYELEIEDGESCNGEDQGRFYSFRKGNIRFFMLNTADLEPGGLSYNPLFDPDIDLVADPDSREGLQAWWLREAIKESETDPDERFQVVVLYTPPYSVNFDDGNANGNHVNVWDGITDADRNKRVALRWPFKEWGADVLLSGEDNNYQYIDMGGLPLVINGLGGHPKFKSLRNGQLEEEGVPVLSGEAEYKFGYNQNYGAIKGTALANQLKLEFFSIDNPNVPVHTVLVNPNKGTDPYFKFASVADYGCSDTYWIKNEGQPDEYIVYSGDVKVSKLIESWDPEYIISGGDDNYQYASRCKDNMNAFYTNAYYDQFIDNDYAPFDNQFFPVAGNHDYQDANGSFSSLALDPWLSHFPTAYYSQAPENTWFRNDSEGRYYTVKRGNVRFFFISTMYDSKTQLSPKWDNVLEPDGVEYDPAFDELNATPEEFRRYYQAYWLKNALYESQAQGDEFQVVVLHQAPLSTSEEEDSWVNAELLKWPLYNWGVDLVLSADDHLFEHWEYNGLDYVVNGTGGHPSLKKPDQNKPTPAGAVMKKGVYGRFGAMKVSEYPDRLELDYQYLTEYDSRTQDNSSFTVDGSYKITVYPRAIGANSPAPVSNPVSLVDIGLDKPIEEEAGSGLNVYPNPTNGLIHFDLEMPEGGEATVDIVSLNGRSIFHQQSHVRPGRHSVTLDLGALSGGKQGMYILRVVTDGKVQSKKILYTGGTPDEEEE